MRIPDRTASSSGAARAPRRACPEDIAPGELARSGLREEPAFLAEMRALLWHDLASEFDARFLFDYLAALPFELSSAFRRAVRSWAADERAHYDGFRAAHEAAFRSGEELDERLAARRPDFEPLGELFSDEFSAACLLAYDELVTVRGYRANLALYDRLAPSLGRFVRRVIADEARHYASFLEVARLDPRGAERAPEVLARIRAAESPDYRNTFVLDHDDPVYGDAIFDRAAGILLARLTE